MDKMIYKSVTKLTNINYLSICLSNFSIKLKKKERVT